MARKAPTNPRPRSRRRRGLILLLGLPLAVLLVPFLLSRSAVLTRIILPGVSAKIGADVAASHISIRPDATIVAENVRITLPDMDGPAAELFRADRVEIKSSWSAITSGSGEFRTMLLTRPRLRVSVNTENGGINLGHLAPESISTSPMNTVPSVVVRDGVIEFGELAPGGYSKLRELRVEGSVVPTPDPNQPGYAIAFTEGSISDPQGRGLGLTGRVTSDGVTLALRGLALDEWRPENVPTNYRDVFRLMNISGTIPDTTLRIASDGSTEVTSTLDGVSLNLPFDPSGHAADPDRLVRLKEVSGTIRMVGDAAEATLDGKLGDLPSHVHLTYSGMDAQAPFRCEIETKGFALSSHPEILPLAPPIVVKRLAEFSNPTATVDASMVVERAAKPDGSAGPIQVEGTLQFHDGTAAFTKFPYVFHNLEGLAKFDEEKIEIVRITGRSDSGATLLATGHISPPLPGASVDLDIRVEGARVDDALLEAMGSRRRPIVDALFNRKRYGELVAAGLVHPPDQPGPGEPFALGGVANVHIHIARDLGEEAEYKERIRIELPHAGVLPEPFPMPIVANDVAIELDGHNATIVAGSFAGISGGGAEVAATVDIDRADQRGIDMQIEARGIPTDEFLLAALPGGLDASQGARSPSAILRRLGLRGNIDCSAIIARRSDDQLGYDIDVDFQDLAASPQHANTAAPPIRLTGLAGSLAVSERDLSLALQAAIAPDDQDAQPAGGLSVSASIDLSNPARPFNTTVDADLSNLSPSIEDLVAVVAPEVAAKLTDLRSRYQPEGGLVTRAVAEGALGEEAAMTRLDLDVSGCRGLAFTTDTGRMRVTSSAGSLTLSALNAESATFDHFAADITLDQEPPLGVVLDGVYPFARPWQKSDRLALSLRDARFESALVRRATSKALPAGLAAAMEKADLDGVFDADLELRAERPLVTGEIRPRACALTLSGERVSVSSMQGGIRFEETGGSFASCRAEGAGWWAEVSGDWAIAGDGAVIVDTQIKGASDHGLTDEIRALLPPPLRNAMTEVAIASTGPLEVGGMHLRVSLDESRGAAYLTSGRVTFADASAELGVKLTDASGYLDFEAESTPGRRMSNFGIGLILDDATAGGIHLNHAMSRITSDPLSGDVLVPVLLGDAYGGRVSGSLVISPTPDEKREYQAEFKLSGVPLGELLADWEHAAGVERAAETDGAPPERPDAESRGMVDAGLTFTGVVGDPTSRRGRGAIEIGGGGRTEVLRLPLLLPLIQVSNLQIPQNDRLDFAETVFFVEGERVVFERVGVFAQSVELFGYGSMTLPGLDLDLRFNSRAVNRLPLLSDLMEKFRNELITTKVAGTVKDPQVSVVQFQRTRQVLSEALGREPTEEERRMMEIERLSRESVLRQRRAARNSGSPAGPGGYAPGQD